MKNDCITLLRLVRRDLEIFLKDRATVFFSLLSPLIVLLLYILFLGKLQMDNLKAALQGMPASQDAMQAFVDGWMLSGVMCVACITVAFSANNIMVQDKARGVLADMQASPVKRSVISLSYLLYNYLVTAVICGSVLVVALVYLAISGWYLSVADVFGLIGVTAFSILSSGSIGLIVLHRFRSEAALGGFIGILSAAIGFLCGAYFPLSAMPKGVQYAVLFVPGTYSACMFRHYFMRGALEKMTAAYPAAAPALQDGYSMTLEFWGGTIGFAEITGIFAVTVFAVAVIGLGGMFLARYRRTHGRAL